MNFIIKNLSRIFFFISILIFFYTHYKSFFIWENTKFSYYRIYYIISIIIFFLSIFLVRVSFKFKRYIVIIFFSIIFPLYTFEIYIYIFGVNKLKFNFQTKYYQNYDVIELNNTNIKKSKNFDTREIYKFYLDEKLNYKNLELVNYPQMLEIEGSKLFNLSGISKVNAIVCNESGDWVIHETDRYGFNNPDEQWNKKVIDYLILGDSAIQGQCVNRPNDISSLFRSLSKKTTINFGFGGNGPLRQLASLKEYFDERVKNIIWFYNFTDIYDLKNELKNEILIQYLNNSNFTQGLKNKQNLIDLELKKINREKISNWIKINTNAPINKDSKKNYKNLLNFVKLSQTRWFLHEYVKFLKKDNNIFVNEKLNLININELSKREYLDISDKNSEILFSYIKDILKEAKQFSEEKGTNFYLINLDYALIEKNFKYSKNIHEILNSLNINYHDTHDIFRGLNDVKNYFANDGVGYFPPYLTHYNEKGYLKIYNSINKYLFNEKE